MCARAWFVAGQSALHRNGGESTGIVIADENERKSEMNDELSSSSSKGTMSTGGSAGQPRPSPHLPSSS